MAANPKVYIGPSFPGGKLKQYAVFSNGLPKWVEELIEKKPVFGAAFIDTRNLSDAMRALSDPDRPEYAMYQALKGEV